MIKIDDALCPVRGRFAWLGSTWRNIQLAKATEAFYLREQLYLSQFAQVNLIPMEGLPRYNDGQFECCCRQKQSERASSLYPKTLHYYYHH